MPSNPNPPPSSAEWDRPPGALLVGTLVVVLLAILESASRLAELLPVYAWLAVGGIGSVWLVRFVVALRQPRDRRAGAWARWLLVPALVAATIGLVALDVPFLARLELGRAAMTADAEAALADPASARASFGLFPAVAVGVYDVGGLSFVIGGSGFIDSFVLTYSPDGPPVDPYNDVEFSDLGGGWWRWTLEF